MLSMVQDRYGSFALSEVVVGTVAQLVIGVLIGTQALGVKFHWERRRCRAMCRACEGSDEDGRGARSFAVCDCGGLTGPAMVTTLNISARHFISSPIRNVRRSLMQFDSVLVIDYVFTESD